MEVYAERSTRREYNKRYSKKRQKEKLIVYIIWPLILALILCNAIYIYSLQGKVRGYEETVTNLEGQLNSANEYVTELHKALEDSSALIDEMSSKMMELESQNNALEEKMNNIQEQIDKTTVTPVARVDKHTDLSIQTVMTTDRMNYIIDQWNEREGGNCRFVGHGQAFIDASRITGIDPVAILALSAHESGFGTSRIARTKNNFMGIGAYDASPYSSSYTMGDSIDQGIIQGAIWVADNYYEQGQTTLYQMIYGGKTYSTSKDKWINDIVWLWNKSYKI